MLIGIMFKSFASLVELANLPHFYHQTFLFVLVPSNVFIICYFKVDYREVCQEMIKASWCGILASLSLLLEAR